MNKQNLRTFRENINYFITIKAELGSLRGVEYEDKMTGRKDTII